MNIRIIGKEDAFSKHLKSQGFVYIVLLAVFLIGILGGTIYYKNVTDEQSMATYIENTFSKLAENADLDTYEILKESILKNVGISALFLILGASVIGIPLLLVYIGYRGFTLGFTISSLIEAFGFVKGNTISFVMLFFQNSLMLVAMLVAMVSAIKLAVNLLAKHKDMKIELLRHTIVCAFCMVIFLGASILEAVFNGPVLGIVLAKLK
ncbi:MAG: stage II sporulation protein M [Clostridia bacterium]|nr:stage II sporulation protein M [Clostridia bacterium]